MEGGVHKINGLRLNRAWYTRREVAADPGRFAIVGELPPLPTSDVLGQEVLAEMKANPTATASSIVKKLGVRRAAGLRAVKRARLALVPEPSEPNS